ncbi:MAG: hypothetical protein HY744_06955 [Deltaproteobacteria bacterium]|nr:hypothetical protein [Deltaproteobacteria bacterium]
MGRRAVVLGWVALAGGGVLLAAVVLMARADAAAERPVYGLVAILAAGALAVAAATYGLVELGAGPPDPAALGGAGPASFKHVRRLVLVLLLLGAGALVARAALVPRSYGQFGFYRGEAAREAMAPLPLHRQQQICAGCHADQVRRHDKDVHGGVECEACHGPGADHVESFARHGLFRPPEIFVPKTKGPCLWCHRRLGARPSSFPQIDPGEHYGFLGVQDEATGCMRCHDPHEPLFLDRPLAQARLHPLIQRCRDCHATPMDERAARPEDHPAIFECSYCHGAVAQDLRARPHRKLACNRCHLFHRDSETAGRIVAVRDSRFCLLCHRKTPFREHASRPLVEWPAHGVPAGASGGPRECLECHAEAIHGPKPKTRPGGAP